MLNNEGLIDIAIVLISSIAIVTVIWILDKGLHREPPDDDDCGSQSDDNYTTNIKDWE